MGDGNQSKYRDRLESEVSCVLSVVKTGSLLYLIKSHVQDSLFIIELISTLSTYFYKSIIYCSVKGDKCRRKDEDFLKQNGKTSEEYSRHKMVEEVADGFKKTQDQGKR